MQLLTVSLGALLSGSDNICNDTGKTLATSAL
jgi:hypothetical protein